MGMRDDKYDLQGVVNWTMHSLSLTLRQKPMRQPKEAEAAKIKVKFWVMAKS